MKKNFVWILESSIFLYIADNTSESNAEIQIKFFFQRMTDRFKFHVKNLSAGNGKCLYC